MIDRVDVFAEKNKVGTLALTKEKKVAFQYSENWLKKGFPINPFKLPLTNQVFISSSPYFRGLFGVFADSLPDSFGELVLNRFLRQKGIDSNSLSSLERLAYVGPSGMGMLEYVPDLHEIETYEKIDFDLIQKECNDLLNSKDVKDINTLFSLAGSSGGTRPKALIKYKREDWIIKFSSKFDPKNIAELEFKYMSLAKEFGIDIPEIELITSKKGNKFFLIKRFDRENNRKIHMISVAALLECDFRAPCLDYNDLIKLTRILTNNDKDIIEMYRRMVFNVLIDNQDDHAKNFSFVFDEAKKMYRIAPAYDITQGKTYYGEHVTSVNGKGREINDEDMINVAIKNKIDVTIAKDIINKCHSLLKI